MNESETPFRFSRLKVVPYSSLSYRTYNVQHYSSEIITEKMTISESEYDGSARKSYRYNVFLFLASAHLANFSHTSSLLFADIFAGRMTMTIARRRGAEKKCRYVPLQTSSIKPYQLDLLDVIF